MVSNDKRRSWLPTSLGAGQFLHLLSAMAAFLASFVIPIQYPQFGENSKTIFIVVGCGFIVTAIISAFLPKKIFRSRMQLPREGVVYLGIMLVIAVGALTGGNPDTGNMLLLVFGMMAGPFVLNGWVVVAMLTRITVRRTSPPTAQAGTWFSVEISLKNSKRLLSSRLVEVRDLVEGNRLKIEPRVTFVRVGPQSERTGQYELCIPRRGIYKMGPLRVSSRFPLGIGERGTMVTADGELLVYPAIGRLLPGWKRRERELAESSNRANSRLGIFDDEFHSIREYRPGDNPRAIHWRSSARHGNVMVKEHQQHREAELIILVDLLATPEFTEALQEQVVSLAATLCVEQTRHASSGTYRLAIAGRKLVNLEVTGGSRFRDAAMRALAICEVSSKASLAEMLLAVCQGPISTNSRFVLITPRPEAARLLSESIARESMKNEVQLTSRLLILNASEESLRDVFVPADQIVDSPPDPPPVLPTAVSTGHSSQVKATEVSRA